MTGAPKDMLGTNAPSITSRWTYCAPALSIISIPSAMCPKSTDNSEGDKIIILPFPLFF